MTPHTLTEALPTDYPRAPFLLGVSGNMDLKGYHDDFDVCWQQPPMIQLKEKVFAILDWIRGRDASSGCGMLDPQTGRWLPSEPIREFDFEQPTRTKSYVGCWQGLNLKRTPIILLTSLAPGADTVVAEAVLEYAKRNNDPDIFVRCPLPFPIVGDVYRNATTFNTDAKKSRLDQLLDRLRNQPGFCEERDLFEVALDNDLAGDPTTDLQAIDPVLDGPRRYLRYRAAGEYVATMSHLLLAIYDTQFDETPEHRPKSVLGDVFDSGTAAIVESKRTGLTHELLAMSNNFSWADNGPVLIVPFPRVKNPGSGPAPTLEFRQPYDAEGSSPEPSHEKPDFWARVRSALFYAERPDSQRQRHGDQHFRRMVIRQETFNQLPVADLEREHQELSKLLGKAPTDWMQPLVKSLDRLPRLRRRAADESRRLDRQRRQLLGRMWVLIFMAAVSLGAFEHWSNRAADAVLSTNVTADLGATKVLPWIAWDGPALIQCGWLVVALTGLVWSGFLYHRYMRAGNEEHRYDYRSIGEALRVQAFWTITGTGRHVSADYMQRQRDELDWIRAVVTSVAIPVETTRRWFLNLEKSRQIELFEIARSQWLGVEKAYFQDKITELHREMDRYHYLGWSLLAAGLISIIGMLSTQFSPRWDAYLAEHSQGLSWGMIATGVSLALIGYLSQQLWGKGSITSASPSFWIWILLDYGTWALGVALAGVVLGLASVVGWLASGLPADQPDLLPDRHSAWLILSGATLLAGGLCLAWIERNFCNEDSRVYTSMSFLYVCADRRLPQLIERYHRSVDGSAAEQRLLAEIQDLFYQLGCESLNENAEWLIQHRARPLEPFVAG